MLERRDTRKERGKDGGQKLENVSWERDGDETKDLLINIKRGRRKAVKKMNYANGFSQEITNIEG